MFWFSFGVWYMFSSTQARENMHIEEKALVKAIGLVKGDVDPGIFFDEETLKSLSQRLAARSEELSQLYNARDVFSRDFSAPFPAKPDLKKPALVV
jgi:hypothetical protein